MNKHNKTKKHIIKEHLSSIIDDNNLLTKNQFTTNDNNVTINDNNGNNGNNVTINGNTEHTIIKNIKKCEENDLIFKKNICRCGKIFSHRSGLSRHKKICNNLNEFTNYENKIKNLEQQLVNIQNTMLQTQCVNNTIKNNMSNNNGSFNNVINDNKTINVVTYLNNNYNNVQPLKMLETNSITKLLAHIDLGNNHTIEDHIIYYHSKYLLDQFIGDMILKEFKKSNPKFQQVWLSDLPRLSFLVRTAISKDESIWHSDKKGIILTKNIITPILDEIFILLKAYLQTCAYNMENTDSLQQKEKLYEKIEKIIKITKDINLKILHHKILIFIAPYFQLELNKLDIVQC